MPKQKGLNKVISVQKGSILIYQSYDVLDLAPAVDNFSNPLYDSTRVARIPPPLPPPNMVPQGATGVPSGSEVKVPPEGPEVKVPSLGSEVKVSREIDTEGINCAEQEISCTDDYEDSHTGNCTLK